MKAIHRACCLSTALEPYASHIHVRTLHGDQMRYGYHGMGLDGYFTAILVTGYFPAVHILCACVCIQQP